MMNLDMIEEYLSDKGCTLFGRAFDLSQPTGLRQAARFLADEWEGFDSWLDRWAFAEGLER